MTDFDSPWKEALDQFLPQFLEFFFPSAYQGIDWSRGFEVLDKELKQIVHQSKESSKLADKLFKVWTNDGEETWVLIHVEIQAEARANFARRMFIYNYRVFDKFKREVVSIAILADNRKKWRPNQFQYSRWGCKVLLEFPIVKLLDFTDKLSWLEKHKNPFGLVVLAHLQSQATKKNAKTRYSWKIRLAKRLLNSGLKGEEIRNLF